MKRNGFMHHISNQWNEQLIDFFPFPSDKTSNSIIFMKTFGIQKTFVHFRWAGHNNGILHLCSFISDGFTLNKRDTIWIFKKKKNKCRKPSFIIIRCAIRIVANGINIISNDNNNKKQDGKCVWWLNVNDIVIRIVSFSPSSMHSIVSFKITILLCYSQMILIL